MHALKSTSLAVTLLASCLAFPCLAEDEAMPVAHPAVVRVYKDNLRTHKHEMHIAGLVSMSAVYIDPNENCTQMTGMVKIDGVQFDESGGSLEQIRFRDKQGHVFSVPTHIDELSNVQRQEANSFIQQGKRYFAHIQVCGTSGNADLVNLYDPSVTMGAFE